jgi:hypothetical protein
MCCLMYNDNNNNIPMYRFDIKIKIGGNIEIFVFTHCKSASIQHSCPYV